jgi:hypothetical protein
MLHAIGGVVMGGFSPTGAVLDDEAVTFPAFSRTRLSKHSAQVWRRLPWRTVRSLTWVLDDPRGQSSRLEESWRKKQRNCEKQTGG